MNLNYLLINNLNNILSLKNYIGNTKYEYNPINKILLLILVYFLGLSY